MPALDDRFRSHDRSTVSVVEKTIFCPGARSTFAPSKGMRARLSPVIETFPRLSAGQGISEDVAHSVVPSKE